MLIRPDTKSPLGLIGSHFGVKILKRKVDFFYLNFVIARFKNAVLRKEKERYKVVLLPLERRETVNVLFVEACATCVLLINKGK